MNKTIATIACLPLLWLSLQAEVPAQNVRGRPGIIPSNPGVHAPITGYGRSRRYVEPIYYDRNRYPSPQEIIIIREGRDRLGNCDSRYPDRYRYRSPRLETGRNRRYPYPETYRQYRRYYGY